MRTFLDNGRSTRVQPRHVAAVLATLACAIACVDLLRWGLDQVNTTASPASMRPLVAAMAFACAGGIALRSLRPERKWLALTVAGVGTLLAAVSVVLAIVNGDVTPTLIDLVSAGRPDHIDVNVSLLLLLAGMSVLLGAARVFGRWTPHAVAAAAGLILGVGTMNSLAYAVQSPLLLSSILPLAIRSDAAIVLLFIGAALFAHVILDVARGPIVGRVSAAVAVAAVLIVLETYLSESSSRLAIQVARLDSAGAVSLLDAASAARLGLLTALFAVMVAAVIVITATVARPIKALEGALAAFMQQHREVRLPVIQDDEIGELTIGFNTLAAENAALQDGLERRVEQRTAELAAVNQELESFAYAVSHDLRAPLRAVEGFTRSIVADPATALSEASRSDFERVQAAATRMGQLIDDLLVLSRLTRQELRRERIDVSSLAHEVVSELRVLEPDRVVDVQIQKDIFANADVRLIRVLLTNLLGNAWKFTRKTAKASIEVGTEIRDGETAYLVRDNGAGFDPARIDKLFVPFQRLHSMRDFEGNGIGLATAHRVLQRHGGRIWATGQVGHGASFTFTLPASSPA
jgi:signal transduction histidine kinase